MLQLVSESVISRSVSRAARSSNDGACRCTCISCYSCYIIICVNSLIATLKPQSNGPNGPSYGNTVIGTLTIDRWTVTFGTASKGLDGANVTAHPSTASVPTSYYSM